MTKEIYYFNLDDEKNKKLGNIFKNFMLASYLGFAGIGGYMYYLDNLDQKKLI